MNATTYRVRRATLDDIGALTSLWQSMKFQPDDLSKRVTEFQVAEDASGAFLGAVGLQVAQKQGRIHSEGFTDFSLADQLRPLMWERLKAVANNHGLLRFWTQEDAPFWSRCGLNRADEEALTKLPAAWKTDSMNWLTLKLRDDVEQLISADQEFAVFMQSERDRTQRAFQQAKVLKVIATLIAIGLLAMIAVGAFFILRRNPNFFRH